MAMAQCLVDGLGSNVMSTIVDAHPCHDPACRSLHSEPIPDLPQLRDLLELAGQGVVEALILLVMLGVELLLLGDRLELGGFGDRCFTSLWDVLPHARTYAREDGNAVGWPLVAVDRRAGLAIDVRLELTSERALGAAA